MWVVGAGLILNLAACIANFSHLLHHVGNGQAASFFATFLILWAFLIIGFIMQLAGRVKLGGALLALGSLILVAGSAVLLPVGALMLGSAIAGGVTIVGAIRVACGHGGRVA